MNKSVEDLINDALIEVNALMRDEFLKNTPITPGSALDQSGLENGAEVVIDYLQHGEAGLAYEHLLYMVAEPPLEISAECFNLIAFAGQALGYESSSWQVLRVAS
jgi:hypothetical protein